MISSVRAIGTNEVGLCEIQVTINEVRKIMEEQDVRKASGPDEVSNWTVRVQSTVGRQNSVSS